MMTNMTNHFKAIVATSNDKTPLNDKISLTYAKLYKLWHLLSNVPAVNDKNALIDINCIFNRNA